MVVGYFIQSDFLKTSPAKLTTFEVEKSQKAGFLRPIITAKHHIQPWMRDERTPKDVFGEATL